MKVVGLLSGGAPVVMKYQIGETMATAGVPVEIGAAGGLGIQLCETTACADGVGITLDTGTYTTTQGTGENSADVQVSVIINPDAIVEATLSGGATSGTALALQTNTSASAGGTVITTGAEWSSPTYDEGAVWGYSGANAGQLRKISAVDGTTGTVTAPFDYAIAVGDVFLRAPYWPMATATAQLTTTLDQVNAIIAVGTGAAFRTLKLIANDESNEGRTKSKAWLFFGDHFLNANP